MVPEMSSTKDISTAWIRNVMTKPTGDAVLRPAPDVADTTVTGSKPHTHPPTPVENSAHTAKQTLKRKAAETDLPTKHIVADAVGPLSFATLHLHKAQRRRCFLFWTVENLDALQQAGDHTRTLRLWLENASCLRSTPVDS